jgi:hypothetical protein
MEPFFVRTLANDKMVLKRVDPMQVMGMSTKKNYTKIVLSDETVYIVRTSLASALKKLPSDMFIKIHRSTVVSIHFIDYIERDHLRLGGKPVPFNKQYYKSLTSRLNILDENQTIDDDYQDLIKLEKEKDIRGILSILSNEHRKDIINRIFYLWYALLEPDFDESIDDEFRKEMMARLRNDFEYYTEEFENDAYYNAIVGYIMPLSPWFFIDEDKNIGEAEAFGYEMQRKSFVLEPENPMALLVNWTFMSSAEKEKDLIKHFFNEILTGTNPIFYPNTIPAEYFTRIYSRIL